MSDVRCTLRVPLLTRSGRKLDVVETAFTLNISDADLSLLAARDATFDFGVPFSRGGASYNASLPVPTRQLAQAIAECVDSVPDCEIRMTVAHPGVTVEPTKTDEVDVEVVRDDSGRVVGARRATYTS